MARHHNSAIADALLRSQAGKAIVVEAKGAIHGRINELRQLIHYTFVEGVPGEGRLQAERKRYGYWIYRSAERKARALAAKGGAEYDSALFKVKQAWTGPEAFQDAVEVLTGHRVLV